MKISNANGIEIKNRLFQERKFCYDFLCIYYFLGLT